MRCQQKWFFSFKSNIQFPTILTVLFILPIVSINFTKVTFSLMPWRMSKLPFFFHCSLNALFMFNPGFDMYPTWKFWICFMYSYFRYHILRHMPKRQMMICTQQILHWYWFVIVPFFWCLIFCIFFGNKMS